MRNDNAQATALYRLLWRWHFYAGLLVIPLMVLLASTGAVYLFKPQLDQWQEREYRALPVAGEVSPDAQLQAALAAYPGATFHSYRLPEAPGDAAMIHLALPGRAMRDVFVSPQGKVLGSRDPETLISEVVQKLHGQLLLGHPGSWLVEIAASWAIVLILSGLYLWWPRGRGLAGVLYPRLSAGGRLFWRDLHAVGGFWVSALALVLLFTGLPWAHAWGSAFKAVRAELGWVKGAEDWTIGGTPVGDPHAEHDHAAMMAGMDHAAMGHTGMAHIGADHAAMGHGGMGHGAMAPVRLSEMVAKARGERLAFPVLVTPPGGPARFGRKGSASWTVRSDSANRPLRVTITYDAMTGRELAREGQADKHVIDRVLAYGIAWHEGQLLGWINQLIGLLTAVILVVLPVSGFVMWRRRKPQGQLGAPPLPPVKARIGVIAAVLGVLMVLLPLLTLSLLAMILIDALIVSRIARLSRWLGTAQ